MCRRKRSKNGFSLVELVIVVVIIAIIGAIAIPRLSRGAAGAADSSLVGDLAVLRNAIDLYAVEHGNEFPAGATFEDELTLFTDDDGNTNATKTAIFKFGPYLRKVPPLPVGTNKGKTTIAVSGTDTLGDTGFGWFYNATTGAISANLADGEQDESNVDYNDF